MKSTNKQKVSLIIDKMVKEGRNYAEVIVALRLAGFSSNEVDEVINHRSNKKTKLTNKMKN